MSWRVGGVGKLLALLHFLRLPLRWKNANVPAMWVGWCLPLLGCFGMVTIGQT
jgi:hypothetical protein